MTTYWYVSTAKIGLLSQHYRRGMFDAFKELGLRLKSPIAEAELRLASPDPSLLKQLHSVDRQIRKELSPPAFESPGAHDSPPPYVTFEMQGARLVNELEFWIAGYKGDTGIVLVGATKHTLGGYQKSPNLSPSIDPLGTIMEHRFSHLTAGDLSTAASYAWQEIMRHNGQHQARLPQLSGLAVTIAVVDARRQQTRRTGIDGINKIVIGTPLYVSQS